MIADIVALAKLTPRSPLGVDTNSWAMAYLAIVPYDPMLASLIAAHFLSFIKEVQEFVDSFVAPSTEQLILLG